LRTTAHIVRFVLLLLIAGIFPLALRSRPADLPATGKEISLQEYIAELRAATVALDDGSPTTIHNFRLSLPSEWIVTMDNQSISVKTDWLVTALFIEESQSPAASNHEQVRQARQRLNALRESAEALLAPPAGADLAQAHGQVDRILRGREFQGSHEPSWLDKFKARVYAWISRQLEKLFGRMGISTSVGNTIAWILVTIIGLLLTFWVVRSMLAAAARSELDLQDAAPAGHDWRYWANVARSAAGRGDYRAAIHAAYWTAVAQLEENRLLPGDRSRTPRESLGLLERGSAAYAPMAHLTRRFELTWYGYRAATSADWNDAVKHLEAIECLRTSTRAIASS
jgi:Domain of unknown function (DUF4129)